MSGKLYSYILNKHLTQWIENNKLLNEAQAGFRQGYSIIVQPCVHALGFGTGRTP